MSNKIKQLICSLLATAMLVTSAGVVAWAAPEDEATGDTATETTVTETADDSSTADQTDDEKESDDAERTADEGTDTTATDATDAPAATAAPAATKAADYENDDYYQKALALCSSLGVISGFEDGSVKPEEKVTRAQMASIVLRMLALSGTSPYQGIFTDVSDSHWAASQIQSAYEASIVNGMGDGTFAPDAEVTYAQVMVMLVNAMNYKEDADYYGGWQQGYIKEAGEIGLLKNAPGSADVASDRGVVIKMVYNALLADYKEVRTYDEYGQPKYSTDKTLAEVKFDVIEAKGMLIGTEKTSLRGDVQEGQLLIDMKDGKDVTAETYDTILTGLEDYVGQYVTYYYRENSGKTDEVLAVTYDSSKSETYEISDIDDIENVKLDGGKISIKLNKVSKERTAASDARYIYNGKVVTDLSADEIKDLIDDMEQGNIKMVKSDKSLNDYDIVFIDSYITMIVTSANETKLIGKVQDPDAEVGETMPMTINVDTDKKDRTITVYKAGNEARLRNLKKNDVASVRASLPITDPEFLEVTVTGEGITGTASSVSAKEMNNTYATINGDRYDIANVAVGDLKTGNQSTFYLDKFGRVGYIESTGSKKLEAGEKYGWIMGAYKQDGGDFVVKLMSEDGPKEYKLASSVNYWAPNASEGSGSLQKSTAETEIKKLFNTDGQIKASAFPAAWSISSDNIGTVGQKMRENVFAAKGVYQSGNTAWRLHKATQGNPFALVKFKTNTSDAVTKLYFAVSVSNYSYSMYDYDWAKKNWDDATWNAAFNELKNEGGNTIDNLEDFKTCLGWATAQAGKDDTDVDNVTRLQGVELPYYSAATVNKLKNSDALLVDVSTNLNGAVLVGGLVDGYVFEEGIPELSVPDTLANYNDEASYSYTTINVGSYNLRENGISFDAYVADADGTTPGIVIRMATAADEPVDSKIGTADNISMMVVDKINTAYDKNEDMTVYKVVGYTSGAETSFTTTKTTSLYDNPTRNNKDYGATLTWDGKNGGADGESDSLAYYLHEGDLIVQSGGRIIRIAKASDIAENNGVDTGSLDFGSDTRVKYFWGPVEEAEIDTVSWIKVSGQSFSVDESAAFDVVEIDKATGSVKLSDDLSDIGDLDTATDYAYVRIAPKGALGEIVIYRFVD